MQRIHCQAGSICGMTRYSIPDSQYHLQSKGSLVVLVLLALVVGVVAGLVGAVFRITLERARRNGSVNL